MSDMRENYFILLELPFDPPIEDKAKIEAAITAKQQQWSKDQLVAFKKAKASAHLAMIDDIRDVMLDPVKRAQEANAAKKIRDEKTKELVAKLRLYVSKGESELNPRDMKNVLNSFKAFGFNEDYIKNKYKELFAEKKGGGEKKPLDMISKQIAKEIATNLNALGGSYVSLYDLLGLNTSASCASLCETAKSIKQKILEKGQPDPLDTARKSLCDISLNLFKDANGKRKYDNYYSISKYVKLNIAIDEIARSNKNAIDHNMKDGLIEVGQSVYKISLSEASLYIDNYCAFQGYKLTGNTVHCAHCNIEYPAGTETCPKCGKHIVITCPKCGRQNDNITKTCQCGFKLDKIEGVLSSVAKARELLAAKKYAEVEPLLVEPRSYWPDNKDLRNIEESIKKYNGAKTEIEQKISKDIEEKKFYSAKSRILSAKNDGYDINVEFIDKIEKKLSDIESRLASVKGMEGDDAFSQLLSLCDDVADSEELKTQLSKYPPENVQNVRCTKNGTDVVISWDFSISKGNIEYVLVRKENSHANGTKNIDPLGIEVYRGKESSFTDSGLKTSTVYFYIVVAVRAGIESNVSRLADAVVIVDNVSAVKAIGGDGIINLSWKKPSTVSEIKLWTYKGNSQPLADEDYNAYPCNRLDGETISGLENGYRYWLKIRAYHTINGKSYPSDDMIVNAVPEKPAEPLANFKVQYTDEKFNVRWKESEWDIVLFYSAEKPEYAIGVIYDINDLLEKYSKIDFSLRSKTEADFALDFTGECYIIPGVIRATNVILNEAAYVSSIPVAKNPSVDVNAGATEMYINFDWPKKIDHALLLYKPDEYPTEPDDIVAKKIEINKKQYDMDAGIIIRDPEKGVFYATIFTFFEAMDHRIYSEGVRLLINNEPQREVYYSIKYSKGGLFSKKRILSVTVKSSGNFVLPPFVVVGRAGLIPGTRDKGFDICTQRDPVDVNISKTMEFEVSDVQKGTKVRMFFLNEKNYSKFKVQNEGSSDI